MKTMHILALLILVGLHAPAQSETCNPDWDNWKWLTPDLTMDNALTPTWSENLDAINNYWYLLNLTRYGVYWNDMISLAGGPGNVNSGFTRLINGAVMLDWTYWNMNNITLNQSSYAYSWLGFVAERSGHSFVGDCQFSNSLATHYSDDDIPTHLHYKFFYWLTAVERGGTLVHECTHEYAGHLDSSHKGHCTSQCSPSCDTAYGDPNAQTMEINFLAHAMSAYQRDEATDELLVAELAPGICGYVPMLDEQSRWAARETIHWKLDNCFGYGSSFGPNLGQTQSTWDPFWDYGGRVYSADLINNARWSCAAICNVADYQSGGQATCNEEFQSGNSQVNLHNVEACNAALAATSGEIPPSKRHQAVHDLQASLQECIPGYSDQYLAAYCRSLSASTISGLETSWNLQDQPGVFDAGAALEQCTQQYCQENFQQTWKTEGLTNCYEWSDSVGCADTLCGSLAGLQIQFGNESLEYFEAIQCRRHFFENNGDVNAYLTAIRGQDMCEHDYMECVNNKARQEWLADKATGQCSLSTQTPSGPLAPTQSGQYNLVAMQDILDLSFEQFQAAHPNVSLNKCMAENMGCIQLQQSLAEAAAELVAITQRPYGIERLKGIPDFPPIDEFNPVDRNLRRSIETVVSGVGLNLDFTKEKAMDRLLRNPEAQHAFSKALGQETYFALFGTKSREAIFGTALLNQFQAAQVAFDPDETTGQRIVRLSLLSGKATRERFESSVVQNAMEQASSAQPVDFYRFTQALGNAADFEAFGLALDQLGAIQ